MIQITNAIERYNTIILAEMKEANIKCWIAGGAIRDYFMGTKIKTDYDMFFPNQQEYEKAVVFFKAKNAVVKWESDNGCKVKYNNRTFDLVKHFFSDPQTTIDAFDFTVCMFAVDTDKLYYGETSFIDLAKRQLMINKILYPASTMKRAFKYYEKGFKMCVGEMAKMVEAIRNDMPSLTAEQVDGTEENDPNTPPSGGASDIFRGID